MLRTFLLAIGVLSLLVSPASAAPTLRKLSPTHGTAGIEIRLTGVGFGTRQGTVTFGKLQAQILVWRKSSIRVLAPEGTSSVRVRVITRRGRSNSLKFRFDTSPHVTPTPTASPTPVSTPNPPPPAGDVVVLGANDLGMHCVDKDFSVFSILPPFNVLNAQAVRKHSTGLPELLGASDVSLSYEAITDPNGSRNSTSVGKSNFWTYAASLFGANLREGLGLTGLAMPADASNDSEHSFSWDDALGLFIAKGVPILPYDDAQALNRYPLLRIVARDKTSGAVVGASDVVVPVSEETTCQTCHVSGGPATSRVGVPWVTRDDKEIEARENVLLLHDAKHATALTSSKPVLCASCHYSPALDLAGAGPSTEQQHHGTMSAVMHAFHADKMRDGNGQAFSDEAVLKWQSVPSATAQACYQCHPGASTKCLRGAMSDTVSCQNCHGTMDAVGGGNALQAGGSIDGTNDGHPRRPWKDLPRCQSCHTGDAVTHANVGDDAIVSSSAFRLLLAYDRTDPAASPRTATNARFAEESGKLFRHSKGHGGLACESCHGSTHAIWPNADSGANDNVTATELQGHSGTVGECATCHTGTLPLSLGGPHGMHPVNNARWIDHAHSDAYERNAASCKACHGTTLRGTALSLAFADRTVHAGEFGTKTFKKGDPMGCYSCHNGPGGDD